MLTEKLTRYGTLGTHDALKLVALLSMFADHLGAFVYPDIIWLRLVGRLAAPIFFFLIGYSRSYRIHADLVIGAAIMIGVATIHMHALAELNILVSFIFVRLFFLAAEKRRWLLAYPGIVFCILIPFSMTSEHWIEYGTIGWMFALCGYMQKNAARYSIPSRFVMMFLSFWFFALYHIAAMVLLAPAAFALAEVLFACAISLWFYRPRPLNIPAKCRKAVPLLAWPARYSLWIYVVHLATLQLITGLY